MKAILIDSKNKTITEVQHDGTNENIYKLCGYEQFDCCDIGNRDAIFVDGEGLFKKDQTFFIHKDYPQPLAGNGLILGCNSDGESTAPKTTLAEVKAKVKFMSLLQAYLLAREQGV